MLVFTRKSGDSVYIGETVVHFGEVRRGHVKVAIDAPSHVRVVRGELIDGPLPRGGERNQADHAVQPPGAMGVGF